MDAFQVGFRSYVAESKRANMVKEDAIGRSRSTSINFLLPYWTEPEKQNLTQLYIEYNIKGDLL